GPEWTTDKAYGKSRTRLCFANPSHEAIRAGVAALAEVCRREFGVPNRIANVEQARAGSRRRCRARTEKEFLLRIGIMGSGGVGGYFGARLQRGGADVTFVARGAHLAAMRANGLAIESEHE